MMYIETISDSNDTFRIERQKNTPNGKWYSIMLTQVNPDVLLADNDSFIFALEVGLRDNPYVSMQIIGIPHNKDHVKLLRKIIRKAIKLGWFNPSVELV